MLFLLETHFQRAALLHEAFPDPHPSLSALTGACDTWSSLQKMLPGPQPLPYPVATGRVSGFGKFRPSDIPYPLFPRLSRRPL